MTDVGDKTSDFIKDLGDAARRNPVSAALIGMGVLWMMTGGRGAGKLGDLLGQAGLDRVPATANAIMGDLGSRVSSGADAMRTAANASADAVREQGSAAFTSVFGLTEMLPDAGSVIETARGNLADLFRAQPLALGAIGLAIGAGIAAALPTTETEDTYMGEASETIRNKAVEIAGNQADKVTTLAADVIEAAASEARDQGLTADGARAAAQDLAGRVSRVVDAAKKTSSEHAG